MDYLIIIVVCAAVAVYLAWATAQARESDKQMVAIMKGAQNTMSPPPNPGATSAPKMLKEREEFIEMLKHLLQSGSLDSEKARETLDVWDRLHQATNGTPIPDENPFGPPAPPKTDDTCPECGDQFAMSEDYLCPSCREQMNA
jgi:hypothetical protein